MPKLTQAYYVHPTAIRDEVRSQGILPQDEGDEIWLYSDRDQALREGADAVRSFIATPEGSADVWQVDLSDLPAELIANMGDMEDVTVALEHIDSDRLTLLQTF